MRSGYTAAIPFLLFVAATACSSEPDPADPLSDGASGVGGASAGASGAGGMPGSGGANAGGGDAGGEVPASSPEIFAYLQRGGYLGFPSESAPHASTGPHGGKVRTYLSPSLEASLAAGNAEHPSRAAVVKELYGSGESVIGWAAMVKTQAESEGGQGWFWYEVYSATDPSRPVAAANGDGLCVGCHSAGADYVLTPFPLQ